MNFAQIVEKYPTVCLLKAVAAGRASDGDGASEDLSDSSDLRLIKARSQSNVAHLRACQFFETVTPFAMAYSYANVLDVSVDNPQRSSWNARIRYSAKISSSLLLEV